MSMFYWKEAEGQRGVKRTCILVIHYEFKDRSKEEGNRSEGDKIDVKRLKLLFENRENITSKFTSESYKSISKAFEDETSIDEYLGLKGKTRGKWKGSLTRVSIEGEKPELFVVFISTHGLLNGILETDKGETFNIYEFCGKIKNNTFLKDAMKLFFVSACRGDVAETNNTGEPIPEHSIIKKHTENTERKDLMNMNSTRVTTQPDCDNFVFMFSCVEGTYSFRIDGTLLIQAFCDSFDSLEVDVSLIDFFTRVQWQAYQRAKNIAFKSTPEAKILKHRSLVIRKPAAAVKTIAPPPAAYNWMSNDNIPLLQCKALVYADSESAFASVRKDLRESFDFEVKRWDSVADLKKSISAPTVNKDFGCVLVLVIAEILTVGQSNEYYVNLQGEEENIPIKAIMSSAVFTKDWIGKPKIFVFLSSKPEAKPCGPNYVNSEKKNKKCGGTLHAGMLITILPQTGALDKFREALKEFTKPERITTATFQQFFIAMLQNAGHSEDGIPPMVVSTMNRPLKMKFQKWIPMRFTKPTIDEKSSCTMGLGWMLKLIISKCKKRRDRQAPISPEMDNGNKVAMFKQSVNPVSSKAPAGPADTSETEDDEEVAYAVYVVSAEACFGKSYVAKILKEDAQDKSRKVTYVDLTLPEGFKSLVDKFKKLFEQPTGTIDPNEIFFLDAFDALQDEERKNVQEMAKKLAQNKVDLWIFTRTEYEAALQEINPCTLIKIERVSEDTQIDYLEDKLKDKKMDRSQIKDTLKKINEAHAEDLLTQVGNLERLMTFEDFDTSGTVNIYDMGFHIVNTAIKSCFYKLRKDVSKLQKFRDNKMNRLYDLALKHLNGQQASLSESCVERELGISVRGTLAACLYCWRSNDVKGISSQTQVLRRMFDDKRKSDEAL